MVDETTALTASGSRLILCGWCHWPTDPDERCQHCKHERPAQPWEQRGDTPPMAQGEQAGRPKLEPGQIRQRLRIARRELGPTATNAALAEHLDVSERTLARWQKLAG